MNFWQKFSKEFWPRLFWAVIALHVVFLALYLAAPTIQI